MLAAAGPGPVTFDLLAPVPEAEIRTVGCRRPGGADSLATPRAVVTFHAHAALPVDGRQAGRDTARRRRGHRAGRVRARPGGFLGALPDEGGQTMSWQDLPALPTGFFTPDAEGLAAFSAPRSSRPVHTVPSHSRPAHRPAPRPSRSSWPAGSTTRSLMPPTPDASRSARRWCPSRVDWASWTLPRDERTQTTRRRQRVIAHCQSSDIIGR